MIQVFAKVLTIRPDGELLVLRRSADDERRPGEWDFPGGGVEAGESPNQGAARELMEEAGIEVDPQDLTLVYAETSYYEPAKHSNTRVLFLVHVSEAQAAKITLSHEHDAFKWQPPEVALREHPHPVYRAGLAYVLAHNLQKS